MSAVYKRLVRFQYLFHEVGNPDAQCCNAKRGHEYSKTIVGGENVWGSRASGDWHQLAGMVGGCAEDVKASGAEGRRIELGPDMMGGMEDRT